MTYSTTSLQIANQWKTRDLELDPGRDRLRRAIWKSATGDVRHRWGDTITRLKEWLVVLLDEDTVDPLEGDTVDLLDAKSVALPREDTAVPPDKGSVAPQIEKTPSLHVVERASPQNAVDLSVARHLRVDGMI